MFQNIQLKANFHEMRLNPSRPVYQYKLEITDSSPEKVSEALKKFRPQLQTQLILFMSLNQNIYSPKLIQEADNGLVLGSLSGNETNQDTATLKLVGKIENKADLNIIISRLFKQVIRSQLQMVSVGNKGQKLFWSSRAQQFKDQNLEIWPGVECIFRPGEGGAQNPTLVIDCAFKMLRYRSALEELNQTRNPSCIQDQIVMTTYNKKFYKVEAVDVNLKPASTFTNEKGETISFAQYYEQRYKVKVDGNQPLIRATVRSKQDKTEKTIHLIPQLCQLTGLTDAIRNDFNAMKNLAVVTKPGADQRMKMAQEFANQLANTEIVNKKAGTKRQIFKEWGVEINPGSMDVPARRIHPGNMLMGNGLKLDLSSPQTNLDRQTQTQMFSTPPQQLILGIIYNKKTGQQTMDSLMQNFQAACNDFKFQAFMAPKVFPIEQDRDEDLERVLDGFQKQAEANKAKVGFLLFLLPGQKKKARLYKTAKKISMQKFGCASQVVVEKTLAKNTRSIVNKILIQLNAKVGGTPWAIDSLPLTFQNQPTMICGTDCFVKSGRKNQLAFCSTVDRNLSRYYSQVVTSGEFSQHLQSVFKASLLAFKEQNGIFPKLVIIYRDGVGDGQQAVVLANELPQYKQALEELQITDTKISVVVCNKRVSAKFYTGGNARPDNPQPGTCVDNPKVVEQSNPNFYLISQVTRQGTVTPSLYKIIHSDQAGLDDDIKVLTFKLCWLFYNFTGSIKIPAPVRYAHCLCNFIGDNYDDRDQVKFLPLPDLVKQKVLFYI
ncbi:unnamed protein product (macronuclear) [Paramecium tetraurelia]|uniref:Chromosome undetermined scaffold_66, whole genome shotgun sequence n=1 Tax=Paramecium tetraurelia TaxID=5888 RepID=Q3SE53_PARTE|nr:uncharacterized protein GSPATT00020796001 [Paramecium tetraurelia]CAI39072.1 PAZ and PIWI domain protein [Paramecium tetraurelia]CAK87143.1 unnamed protein product [Paramecium tetraurelia]|eukprot:XP_001454540.1 hypothetical protein (macronuclear) [Paramecium tetraurelia strain d4-2]